MRTPAKIISACLAIAAVFSGGVVWGALAESKGTLPSLQECALIEGKAIGEVEAADKYLTRCTDALEEAAAINETCTHRLFACIGVVKGGMIK